MIREIITKKRELAVPCIVQENEGLVKAIVQDLTDTIRSRPKCIAISANQIGYNARVIVIQQNKGIKVLINPKIISRIGAKNSGKEGCLSRPDETANVSRHANIRLEYTDIDGDVQKRDFRKRPALVVQHMLDHLDGRDCFQGVKDESSN